MLISWRSVHVVVVALVACLLVPSAPASASTATQMSDPSGDVVEKPVTVSLSKREIDLHRVRYWTTGRSYKVLHIKYWVDNLFTHPEDTERLRTNLFVDGKRKAYVYSDVGESGVGIVKSGFGGVSCAGTKQVAHFDTDILVQLVPVNCFLGLKRADGFKSVSQYLNYRDDVAALDPVRRTHGFRF